MSSAKVGHCGFKITVHLKDRYSALERPYERGLATLFTRYLAVFRELEQAPRCPLTSVQLCPIFADDLHMKLHSNISSDCIVS